MKNYGKVASPGCQDTFESQKTHDPKNHVNFILVVLRVLDEKKVVTCMHH